MKIEFVHFSEDFLELSWNWLNDPEIKILTQTPDFTKQQQEEWFLNLKNNTNYSIWGVTADRKPIGAAGLKNITTVDCEYFGYIGEKDYWGLGIGKIILKEAIIIAKRLGKKEVWLAVNKSNDRAIKLYTKYGFGVESQDENEIKMRINI